MIKPGLDDAPVLRPEGGVSNPRVFCELESEQILSHHFDPTSDPGMPAGPRELGMSSGEPAQCSIYPCLMPLAMLRNLAAQLLYSDIPSYVRAHSFLPAAANS